MLSRPRPAGWNHESPGEPMTISLVHSLQEHAAFWPERETLRFLHDDGGSEALTYGELERRVRAVATWLQARTTPGDRVVLLLPSSVDYVVGFYGCLFAGVIAIPAYPPESIRPQHLQRLRVIVEDCEPRLILAEPTMCEAIGQAFAPRALLGPVAPAAGLEGEWRRPVLDADDVAFLQYTSGSTAAPKGVQVTHANLVANGHLIRKSLGFTTDDTMVSWLPLYHDMGLICGLLQPIFTGFPCVLMSTRSFLERPVRWLEAISRFRGTLSGAPDFAYRLCTERVAEAAIAELDLTSWDLAYSGAEPIRPDTLDGFSAKFAPTGFRTRSFYGCYGLAEATLLVTGGRRGEGTARQACDAAALAGHRFRPGDGPVLASSGRALPDHEVRIVDPEQLTPLAEGCIGEIWVAGPSLAKGYWRNPDATAATFVTAQDRVWLRTGDLGTLHAGQIYVTGRIKDMLIVRGQNVYPQDLERAVEDQVPIVRKGRVAAFAIERDGREAIGIAAEIGRGLRKKQTPQALARAIGMAVADACGEAPALVALLNPAALPKTSSGKLQRSACRARLLDGSLDSYFIQEGAQLADAPYVAPACATETAVARIWQEMLGRDHVGRNDNFLMLGGHSLLAAQVIARLRELLAIELSLRSLLEARTLAEFARAVEQAPPRVGPALRPQSTAPGCSDPLSFAQERIWFFWQLHPKTALYNIAGAARLAGSLDVPALHRSLDRLVARHQVLRTHLKGDEPRAIVAALEPAALVLEDLTHLPEAAREQAVRARADAEARTPFDLAHGPLARFRLLRMAAMDHVMLLTLHHVAVDAWSIRILLDELEILYAIERGGTGVSLPDLPLRYADYARWQREQLDTNTMQRQLDYWRRRLGDDLSVLDLPGRRPLPAGPQDGVRYDFELDAALTRRLRGLAQNSGATLFMVLLAAFSVALHERTGRLRIRIGGDVANRNMVQVERLVGFFVNQVVLQVDITQAASGRELLHQCRDVVIDATEHQDLPFNRLVEALRPPRRAGLSPFFSIKLLYQESETPLPRLAGLTAAPYPPGTPAAELDLVASFEHAAETIRASFVHPRDLFEPETIASLFAQTRAVLTALAEDPDAAVEVLVERAAAVRRTLDERHPDRSGPRQAALPQLRRSGRSGEPERQAS